MSPNLIILGDCNAWMFHPNCDRIRANLHVGPITMSAFCRDDSKFYRDSVFALNSVDTTDATLILSVGKIDLKSQFWRDIPLLVSRGMPMEDYVRQRIEAYLQQIERFIAHYRLRRVILWGAPGTILNDVPHNDVYPTLGNIPTRNALIHIFNVEFIRAIEAEHPRIGFPRLELPDNHIDRMHFPVLETRIFQSLDGYLSLVGCDRLIRHDYVFDEDHFQPLAPNVRRIPYATGNLGELRSTFFCPPRTERLDS